MKKRHTQPTGELRREISALGMVKEWNLSTWEDKEMTSSYWQNKKCETSAFNKTKWGISILGEKGDFQNSREQRAKRRTLSFQEDGGVYFQLLKEWEWTPSASRKTKEKPSPWEDKEGKPLEEWRRRTCSLCTDKEENVHLSSGQRVKPSIFERMERGPLVLK